MNIFDLISGKQAINGLVAGSVPAQAITPAGERSEPASGAAIASQQHVTQLDCASVIDACDELSVHEFDMHAGDVIIPGEW